MTVLCTCVLLITIYTTAVVIKVTTTKKNNYNRNTNLHKPSNVFTTSREKVLIITDITLMPLERLDLSSVVKDEYSFILQNREQCSIYNNIFKKIDRG